MTCPFAHTHAPEAPRHTMQQLHVYRERALFVCLAQRRDGPATRLCGCTDTVAVAAPERKP